MLKDDEKGIILTDISSSCGLENFMDTMTMVKKSVLYLEYSIPHRSKRLRNLRVTGNPT